jgi:hypothetical protein
MVPQELSPGGGPGTKDMSAAGRSRGRADDGTIRRSKGRNSDESQRTRFEYVVMVAGLKETLHQPEEPTGSEHLVPVVNRST